MSAFSRDINRASFNDDGSVNMPENWREWVCVGAPLAPNALNDGEAAFLEYHNIYIEPSAYEHWKASGTWAGGTQFAEELTCIRKGAGCEDATGACYESSGLGYFSASFRALSRR